MAEASETFKLENLFGHDMFTKAEGWAWSKLHEIRSFGGEKNSSTVLLAAHRQGYRGPPTIFQMEGWFTL